MQKAGHTVQHFFPFTFFFLFWFLFLYHIFGMVEKPLDYLAHIFSENIMESN